MILIMIAQVLAMIEAVFDHWVNVTMVNNTVVNTTLLTDGAQRAAWIASRVQAVAQLLAQVAALLPIPVS